MEIFQDTALWLKKWYNDNYFTFDSSDEKNIDFLTDLFNRHTNQICKDLITLIIKYTGCIKCIPHICNKYKGPGRPRKCVELHNHASIRLYDDEGFYTGYVYYTETWIRAILREKYIMIFSCASWKSNEHKLFAEYYDIKEVLYSKKGNSCQQKIIIYFNDKRSNIYITGNTIFQ